VGEGTHGIFQVHHLFDHLVKRFDLSLATGEHIGLALFELSDMLLQFSLLKLLAVGVSVHITLFEVLINYF